MKPATDNYNKCQSYLGLALLSKLKGKYDDYFEQLNLAYREDKQDPQVLCHLSEHYIYLKQYEKAMSLALRGIKFIKKLPRFVIDQKKKEISFRNDYQELLSSLHFL